MGGYSAGRLTCVFIGVVQKQIIANNMYWTSAFYILLLSTTNISIITIAIAGLGYSMAGIYPTTVAVAGNTIKSYPMAVDLLLMLRYGSHHVPIVTGVLDAFGIFLE